MNKNIRYIILMVLIALQGGNIALAIKAAVGISPWDALNQTISEITSLKVGTVVMILNSSLVFMQYLLLKDKFTVRHLSQLAVSFLFGYMINVFLYRIFSFEVASYWINLGLFLLGTCLSAINLGIILNMNLVSFPVEGFCQVLSKVKKLDFVKVRLGVDLISIVISLLVGFAFKLPLLVREGTLIGAIIFSPLLGLAMRVTKPYMEKLNLVEEVSYEV